MSATPGTRGSDGTWPKLAVIGLMYMAQTFPAGFVNSLVPTIYRKLGLPLEQLAILSIALIPYWFRWAWAPIVDTYGSERHGRRKSWFVPCTLLAVLIYSSLALVDIGTAPLWIIVAILFLKSVVTSTQEVAIDAYQVDNLKPEERGRASGLVVVCEAGGQLLALVGLSIVYEKYGWRVAVVLAALLMLIFLLPGFIRREPPRAAETAARVAAGERPSLLRFLRRPDSRFIAPLALFCGLYTGALVPMIGPYLIDQGFSVSEAGRITGLSLLGGTVGGSLLAIALQKSLGVKGVLRMLILAPLLLSAAIVYASLVGLKPSGVIVTALLFMPALALAIFYVLWMTLRIGFASKLQSGTDFSISAGIGRIGQTAAGAMGGPIAAWMGWSGFFIVVAVIGALAALACLLSFDRIDALVRERNLREAGLAESIDTRSATA